MRAVSDYICIVVSYSISNNPRSPRSAPVGDPGPPREVAGKARLGPYMYCNVLYSVQLIKGRFCYCTLYTGFGHAEKVPKLCIPPLITPIRSGGRVRKRAPSSPVRAPKAPDSCRQQSRHVRLWDTPRRPGIAPERSQPTPHIPLVPLVSARTISEPLQSRGGLAWARVPKTP